MRRCRKISLENWGWPLLFSNEKPLFPPISYKNTPNIFLILMLKMRTQSENQISVKEKQKTLEYLLFQNGSCRTPKSPPRKVRKNSGKIQFHEKKRHSVPSIPTVFVGVKIVRQLNLRFFLGQTKFGYLIPMSVLYSIRFCIVVC